MNLAPPDTRRVILQTLPHVRGNTLDLGAGSAKYRPLIEPNTTEYVTFDMHPGPQIDVVGDVHNLPFPDNRFDTIICTQVMEHVQEPWRMVEEIHRILTPGGKCILTCPFLVGIHEDPGDYYRFTSEGVKYLFTRAKFSIVEQYKYRGFLGVVATALRFHFFHPYKPKPGFIRRNVVRVLHDFLSQFCLKDQNTIFYTGNLIVARKD